MDKHLNPTRTLGASEDIAPRAFMPQPWLTWTVGGIAIIAFYLGLADSPMQPAVYDGLAFMAAGAVVFGIWHNHPGTSRAWWWSLAIGIFLLAIGDVVYDLLARSGDVADPSLADVAYLSGTIALCITAAGFLLRHARPLTSLLDALVVAAAFSIMLWTIVVHPQISDASMAWPEFLTVTAYPLLDVVMLSILTVALLSGRPFDRSGGLFAGAVVAFLAADVAYAVVVATGEYEAGIIDVGWLLGYVLWGAAALSIRPGTDPAAVVWHSDRRAWGTARPYVLFAAVAAPLLMAVLQQLWMGESDALMAAAVSVMVSLVVIARLEITLREKNQLLDVRHRLEQTLQRQATEDPLTTLPNRRGLADRLAHALSEEGHGTALLVVDIDDFKAVNDAFGHQAGDELLRTVASRFRAAVRADGTVARLGGDEFAVVLNPCPSSEVATVVAQRLVDCLKDPVSTTRGKVATSISIGIAMSDPSEPSAENLLRDADLALYQAKSAGKNAWSLLDPESSAAALRSLSVASDLARALRDKEFELSFQPIVSLADGRIESLEALVRWRHPARGTILPGEFLSAAEHSIHMPALGRWVLEEACAAAVEWRRDGFAEVGVNVNVSAIQLADDRFPDTVLGGLRLGLPAHLLTLEVLESAIDVTPASSERLSYLREAGIRLAIDDFGTGYSTLSRITEIPATELKLDRSLVAGSGDIRMMRAILRLGQTLGLRLVAEGVESGGELDVVSRLGYDAAQGYHISRPVRTSEVASLLRSWTPRPDLQRPVRTMKASPAAHA